MLEIEPLELLHESKSFDERSVWRDGYELRVVNTVETVRHRNFLASGGAGG